MVWPSLISLSDAPGPYFLSALKTCPQIAAATRASRVSLRCFISRSPLSLDCCRSIQAYRQMPEAPKSNPGVTLRLSGQVKFRKAVEHTPDRDAGLEARDVHACASVIGMTESDVAVGFAA